MANYGVLYRIQFDDIDLVKWQIDICQKDLEDTTSPFMLNTGSNPITIDKSNNDESIFAPIIKTKYTITYEVNNIEGCPPPETFINIENDTFLIKSYKNGELEWKGFISPDNNTYPWIYPPFYFQITATDFSFSESEPINLSDDQGLFLYDYITIGDFLKRALFNSIGYDDPILKILYTPKPSTIGPEKITDHLYLHTDAFYSFTDGARFSFDSLKQFLKSIRARMFFSAGSYWLQFLEDIGTDPQNIITITPQDTAGVISTNIDTVASLGSSLFDEVDYKGQTQEIQVNKALKQQTFNYELKPINQVKNFDWRTDLSAPYDNWQTAASDAGKWPRSGTGTILDPYKVRVEQSALLNDLLQTDPIPVMSRQLIGLSIKTEGILNLGSLSDENYEILTNIVVVVVDLDTMNDLYNMDSSGDWVVGPFEATIPFASKPGKGTSVTEIISKPIPSTPGVNLGLIIAISHTSINPEPPVGSEYYSYIYPIFARVYNNPYTSVREKIVNAPKYSFVADEENEMFFLDLNDPAYSNTIFYDDGGVKKALPLNDWSGQNLDEFAVKLAADLQARPGTSVMGDFISTKLHFHQGVRLSDKNNLMTIQVRDRYNVKDGTHSLLLTELMPQGAATSTYTVTPLTEND